MPDSPATQCATSCGAPPAGGQPRGTVMLEVVIAFCVVAVAILGITALYIEAQRLEVIAREESIALAAAEQVINEMRATPMGGLWAFHNQRRHVALAGTEAPQMMLGALQVAGGDGWKVNEELGVILIGEESPHESYYGDVDGDGDLDFPVDLNLNGQYNDWLSTTGTSQAFPMNLGGDMARVDEDLRASLSMLRLIPVVVVVRWMSQAGLERRIQILTIIGDRLGAY